MTRSLFSLFILASLLGCARQPRGAVTLTTPPPAPTRPAPAPAPDPITPANGAIGPVVREAATTDQMREEDEMAPSVDGQRILQEDRLSVTGKKMGYRPPAAANETAVIENQGNLGAAPLSETDRVELPEATPILTYAKSPCFGDCDVYRLDVLPDGRMTLEVELGFSRPGTYVQTLDAFDRMDLMASLDSLSGIDYEPVYPIDPEAIPDDGSYTLLTLPGGDGRPRSVTVYYDAPEELNRFMRRVRELIEDQAWSPQPR